MLYFDHNATTPLDERVLAEMLPYLQGFYGNASSLYRLGRASRSAIETARAQVAALVGVTPEQVIFTSGGTEANHLALQQLQQGAHLVTAATEHPSLMAPALYWQAQGQLLTLVKVDKDGRVDSEQLSRIPWKQGDWLSLHMAHNETGVLQDVTSLAAELRPKGVFIHSDAVQAVGKIPVDFTQNQLHALSLSSHKIYGPKGCGALIIAPDLAVRPLLHGGGQEAGWRSGTENVPAIVGFGKAAELALTECVARQQHVMALREQLALGLKTLAGAVIFAETAPRLPNTVQCGFLGVEGEMLLMQLDKQGFAVSSGSACASGARRPSSSLTAMGVPEDLAKSALRISLGQQNSAQDVDRLLNAIKLLVPH